MQVFKMSSLDDMPSSDYFPEGCIQLSPTERWNVLQLAIMEIIEQFVDIIYPSSTSKDDDHVRVCNVQEGSD